MTIESLCHEFDKVEVLQVEAQGYTMLWHPEKALEIYKVTDTLRPFRSMHDQASYDIIKAQAHCYTGDFDPGIQYALQGLRLAEELGSSRYVTRLRQMSDRLNVTPLGKTSDMSDLRKEIMTVYQRMAQV